MAATPAPRMGTAEPHAKRRVIFDRSSVSSLQRDARGALRSFRTRGFCETPNRLRRDDRPVRKLRAQSLADPLSELIMTAGRLVKFLGHLFGTISAAQCGNGQHFGASPSDDQCGALQGDPARSFDVTVAQDSTMVRSRQIEEVQQADIR